MGIVDTIEVEHEDSRGHVTYSNIGVYSYQTPDGRKFKTTTRDPVGQLKERQKVEYLPDKPMISRIKGDGCQTITEFLWRKVGLGGLLLVAFISIGYLVLRESLNEFRCVKITSDDEKPEQWDKESEKGSDGK